MPASSTQGVSVVICCHNSEALLPATLAHLARQRVEAGIGWEVVVVDNGSTDHTAQAARAAWPADAPVALRVVGEPQLGLAHARARGIREARYDVITFADDDNWLCAEWIQIVFDLMRDHPEVGALGGIVEPAFETDRPSWFEPVAYLYATGPEGEPGGDVTGRHMLCGAGLNVRRGALADIQEKGFRAIAVGRTGTGVGAGEDSELTYFLRLAGWRLWIDRRLRLRHFLPARRLNWAYARRLAYGSAFATPERDALVYACKPPRTGLGLTIRKLRERWGWQLASAAARAARLSAAPIGRDGGTAREGDRDVLETEFALGRLRGLLAARPWYNARAAEVRNVMKRIHANTRVDG